VGAGNQLRLLRQRRIQKLGSERAAAARSWFEPISA
jgi:hypothetical protein